MPPSTADTPAPAPPHPAKPGSKKKATAVPLTVHPKHLQAIRYVTVMSSEDDAQLRDEFQQFVTEALAHHLGRTQRKGLEFPPKMLAELQELGLIK